MADAPPTERHTGLLSRLIGLLSSIRLGIFLLVALFVYSTIGSAGIVYPVSADLLSSASWRYELVRAWPIFELTEFEWFHTKIFLALCGLLALNVTVTTIRRIPLRPARFGAWIIHSGILVLIAGSVLYFGAKVEGDAPVLRRMVRVTFADGQTATFPALPRRFAEIDRPEGRFEFSVAQIDPRWELLTGASAGETAYSVGVRCQTPERSFVRQVLAGHPELTEDVIPGRGRAIKIEEFGATNTDERFTITLEPAPQSHFWIRDSFALGVRTVGADGQRGPWRFRPLRRMPRYNDRIRSLDDVWPQMAGSAPGELARSVRPLSRRAHPSGDPENPDGLGDVEARAVGYLRYAGMQSKLVGGGDMFNPNAEIVLRYPSGQVSRQRLAMTPPSMRQGLDGSVAFRFAADAEELERHKREIQPRLTVAIPGGADEPGATLDVPVIASDAFLAVGESGWSVRMRDVMHNLDVGGGAPVSLAIIDLRDPEGAEITRWVFEDDALSRDIAAASDEPHGGAAERDPDPRVRATFRAGVSAPIVVVAGAGVGEGALVWVLGAGAGDLEHRVRLGETISFAGGASLTVESFSLTAQRRTKPIVVPKAQRRRNVAESLAAAMAQIELTGPDGFRQTHWLPFHKYTFERDDLAISRLALWEPTPVELPSGERVEIIFTRERRDLPNPVMLDEFRLTTHVGGFQGDTSSIRDWTSELRFETEDGWGPVQTISTNKPTGNEDLRFFQSYWDAPSEGWAGMNFTGLGVGNRPGVVTQLVGCCIAVVGMMYAFYAKPIIKRRGREREMAQVAAAASNPATEGATR